VANVTLLNLFRPCGSTLFAEAGRLSSTLMAFGQRFSEDREKYIDPKEFSILFWKMMHYRPYGPRRRWFACLIKSLDEVPPDSDLTLEQIGCMNFEDCPGRAKLRRIQKLNREDRTEEDNTFIKSFGKSDRFCKGCVLSQSSSGRHISLIPLERCRQVMHCSKDCQKSHWMRHHHSVCEANRQSNLANKRRLLSAKENIRFFIDRLQQRSFQTTRIE
jgi:hypothetical protein